MNPAPSPTSAPPADRTAWRKQLKRAIAAGHTAKVMDALVGQKPKPGWITPALAGEAAALPGWEVLVTLVCSTDLKGLQGMAKTLFEKHENRTILAMAEIGNEAICRHLIEKTTLSGDVDLMQSLVGVCSGRPYLEKILDHSVSLAANKAQWDVYRYLSKSVPVWSVIGRARILLHEMVQSPAVPLDLVAQALAWSPSGITRTHLRGDLLVHAAGRGQTGAMALLMGNDEVEAPRVAEAAMLATQWAYKDVMSFLIPKVDVRLLIRAFEQKIASFEHAPDGETDTRMVLGRLDMMGHYLKPQDIPAWIEHFPKHDLLLTRARLRAVRAGEIDLICATQVPMRRPRLRS